MKLARTMCTAVLPLGYLGCLLVVLLGIASAQTCMQPPAGLVSWWPGEGNAQDIIGDNHGTLQNGATYLRQAWWSRRSS